MKQSLDALVLSVLGHHSPSLTNQQHINSTHPHTQQQGAREGRENRGGERARAKGEQRRAEGQGAERKEREQEHLVQAESQSNKERRRRKELGLRGAD